MRVCEWITRYDQATTRLSRKRLGGDLDFDFVVHRHFGRFGCCWNGEFMQPFGIIGHGIWIKHQRRPPDARRNLLEHLLPFPNYWSVHECEAGDVPARMGQTGDKALSDWIVDKIKYDRNVSRRLSNCSDYR